TAPSMKALTEFAYKPLQLLPPLEAYLSCQQRWWRLLFLPTCRLTCRPASDRFLISRRSEPTGISMAKMEEIAACYDDVALWCVYVRTRPLCQSQGLVTHTLYLLST